MIEGIYLIYRIRSHINKPSINCCTGDLEKWTSVKSECLITSPIQPVHTINIRAYFTPSFDSTVAMCTEDLIWKDAVDKPMLQIHGKLFSINIQYDHNVIVGRGSYVLV